MGGLHQYVTRKSADLMVLGTVGKARVFDAQRTRADLRGLLGGRVTEGSRKGGTLDLSP